MKVMKKIFLYLMLLLATDSLFSQSNELCILQNPNTNNVEIRALSGFVEQPTVGQSITMGGPRSPHGSFYTYDRGVQTKSQLGETGANVLFFLYDKTIGSGTISGNDIVKATASETIFNDATTSIEISVGDVFSVYNATLGFYALFKLQSYDTESDDYTFEISSLIPIKIYYDDNCVIPETVYYNNERYIITEIAKNAFAGCTNLTSVTIPSTVTKVGEKAFSGCTALKNVTCLAAVPPTAYANSFENYNGYLSIPCESKDDYDFASCWGSFKHVECIGAEAVELTKDEVAVVP
ncbi:MAG: leucine-rich repeat protein, partial [Bacteroidales bacterium]|nr:leucine-rich repeat protein [Bacteroidales bacterium]